MSGNSIRLDSELNKQLQGGFKGKECIMAK